MKCGSCAAQAREYRQKHQVPGGPLPFTTHSWGLASKFGAGIGLWFISLEMCGPLTLLTSEAVPSHMYTCYRYSALPLCVNCMLA